MLEVSLSPGLEDRASNWDEAAALGLVERLPLPVALGWRQVVMEEAPWDTLFLDGVETVLKYLGLTGASEYLAEGGEPDFNINDVLQLLGRGGLPLGQWLRLARACVKHETEGERLLPGLALGWTAAEEECWASLRWEKRGLMGGKGARQGLLSTLVEARNKLYGHAGISLSQDERAHASRQLRSLLWHALERLAPVWENDLHLPVPSGAVTQYYRLRGLNGFLRMARPPEVPEGAGYVKSPRGKLVLLHPLTLADRDANGVGTLLDRSAEVYLLSYLKRSRIPTYVGLGGQVNERPDLADHVDALFEDRRVWAKRRDLEVDQALAYTLEKVDVALEYFRLDGLYDAARHVERARVQETLDAYVASEDSRLLLVTGGAGSGKTASLARWAERLRERRIPVLLLRGVELPEREMVMADRLEQWITDELGSAATLDEVLERAAAVEAGRFVVIVEGMNEFADMGRDLNGLWRSINELAERHRDRMALKLVVSVRSDDEIPHAYLPNGKPPSYADPAVYHTVDGKQYYRVVGLEQDEMEAVLRAYNVSPEQAREAVARHGEKLAAPLWLARYADGLLDGAELKKISESGLTDAFVERRVSGNPELKRALTDLARALGGKKTLTLTLDQLREKDRKLADRLEADNRKLLYQLRSLELVRTHAINADDGRPALTISLGHDSLFEALWWKARRKRASVDAILQAALSLGAILPVFVLGVFRQRSSARDLQARSDILFEYVREEIADPALSTRFEQMFSGWHDSVAALLGAHLLLSLLFFIVALLVVISLLVWTFSLIMIWVSRRSVDDFRMAFGAIRAERIVRQRLVKQIVLPSLGFVLLIGLGLWFGVIPDTAFFGLLFGYTALVGLLGLPLGVRLEWKLACTDPCVRHQQFSAQGWRRSFVEALLSTGFLTVCIAALIWGSARGTLGSLTSFDSAIAAQQAAYVEYQAGMDDLAVELERIGRIEWADRVRRALAYEQEKAVSRLTRMTTEPLLDPASAVHRIMSLGLIVTLLGWVAGATTGLIVRRRKSRQAYPIEWGLGTP